MSTDLFCIAESQGVKRVLILARSASGGFTLDQEASDAFCFQQALPLVVHLTLLVADFVFEAEIIAETAMRVSQPGVVSTTFKNCAGWELASLRVHASPIEARPPDPRRPSKEAESNPRDGMKELKEKMMRIQQEMIAIERSRSRSPRKGAVLQQDHSLLLEKLKEAEAVRVAMQQLRNSKAQRAISKQLEKSPARYSHAASSLNRPVPWQASFRKA